MEHLEGVIDKPEKDMSPQELQLHYFKMHDYDGNNLLDGLELATAITHVHREVGIYSMQVSIFVSVLLDVNILPDNLNTINYLSLTAKGCNSAFDFNIYLPALTVMLLSLCYGLLICGQLFFEFSNSFKRYIIRPIKSSITIICLWNIPH